MKKINYKERKRNEAYRDNTIIPAKLLYEPYIEGGRPHGDLDKLILNLIIASGEIPTNIYIPLNITHGTFRAVISELYKKKMIKKNISNALHTYLLSAHGKNVLYYHTPFIRTPNDLPSRKRRVKLARLNALWYGLDVSLFFNKHQSPEDIRFSCVHNELCFINTYHLKPVVTDYPEQIRRSKAFGLLTAFDRQYVVYYESAAVDFYFEEELFRQNISNFIGKKVSDMLLVVDFQVQAAYWIYFLLDHYEYFYGDNPSKYFESVKILIADSNADDSLYVLLNEKMIENCIKQQYPIFDKVTDDKEYHLFLTLDFSKLRYLIARSKYNPEIHIKIVTYPYLFNLIECILKDTSIKVLCIDTEVWNRILSL